MARLDVEELSGLPDEKFIAALTAMSGVGPWTALGALLIALQREDVVFLATWRCARPYQLDHLPSEQETGPIAEKGGLSQPGNQLTVLRQPSM